MMRLSNEELEAIRKRTTHFGEDGDTRALLAEVDRLRAVEAGGPLDTLFRFAHERKSGQRSFTRGAKGQGMTNPEKCPYCFKPFDDRHEYYENSAGNMRWDVFGCPEYPENEWPLIEQYSTIRRAARRRG